MQHGYFDSNDFYCQIFAVTILEVGWVALRGSCHCQYWWVCCCYCPVPEKTRWWNRSLAWNFLFPAHVLVGWQLQKMGRVCGRSKWWQQPKHLFISTTFNDIIISWFYHCRLGGIVAIAYSTKSYHGALKQSWHSNQWPDCIKTNNTCGMENWTQILKKWSLIIIS